ncbi:MAG: amidohydrolase family protein [Deltaproteobacteria bacterium]|nr:amidohydrolase family protein [Deltaproteobacteria bacterium]
MAIIDADAHVLETNKTWEYMEGAEKAYRPQIVTAQNGTGDEGEYWLVDGRLYIKSDNVGKDTPEESREMADVSSRLRHMDEMGVAIQVLYPTIFLRPVTDKPEVELALFKSYNRWLCDIWKQGQDRLRWVATMPLLSMDEALKELEFVLQYGACGVYVPGLIGDRRLSDPYFTPLYEALSDADIPLCVHSATGSFTQHDLFYDEPGFNKFKLAVVGSFHTVIWDRIPERFPRMRIGFIEVSAQWVPYVFHDLAKRFRQKRGIELSRSFMKDNRIFVACQTDDDLDYVLEYTGDDTIVIGTDYGHHDTSSEIEALQKLQDDGKVSPESVTKILDDNPRALYGF